jgi:hypothetical protein
MALQEAGYAPLEPVVVLGLLNSMAVIVANTETLLDRWDGRSADDTARAMLERVNAHARVVTDALEVAAHGFPPELFEVSSRARSDGTQEPLTQTEGAFSGGPGTRLR